MGKLLILVVAFCKLFGYVVEVEVYSPYLTDVNGKVVYSDGFPVSHSIMTNVEKTIDPSKTAIIVMDPWKSLDRTTNHVIENRIIPLIELAKKQHQVLILTNNPKYSSQKIHDELYPLIDNKRVRLLYHDQFSKDPLMCARGFANWLKRRNINTLIYMGFSANQCVIARPMGMIPMRNLGFNFYFIPEASSSSELKETSKNREIQKSTCITIAMLFNGLIHWDEFISVLTRQ